MKRFVTLFIAAILFIMPTLMSCQPTIVDSTPQNETPTTTSSSTTIVDKDPIVMSWYGDGGILLHKYKSNHSPYDASLFDNEYYIGPYEELEVKPGKYFIQSRSLDRPGRDHANGDFYFDNVVLKVNKKYWIYRDHIEEKNW